MSGYNRLILLNFVLLCVSAFVSGIAIRNLYFAALGEQRARLTDTVKSQARLMESIARFNKQYFEEFPGGAEAATLHQIEDAHRQYTGFGETGGFAFARREGNNIVFLHSHRAGLEKPKPIPLDSHLAEPMRRALREERGTIIEPDYLGTEVLAAYEPVAELDMGIVAKIDMSEVRAPFVRAALVATGTGLVVVMLGAAFFAGLTNPMIQRLQQSEHESRILAAIVQSSNDAIIGKDLDGTIQSWNDAAGHLYGYSRDEIVGKPIMILVPPDRHAEIATILQRILRGKRVEPFETVRLRKGGQPIHISLTVSPIKDAAGWVVGASAIARDITERKEAELELLEREHRYRSVIETAGSAIVCVSSEHQIIEWNAEAERIFGYSREEALERNPYELFVAPDRQNDTLAEAEKVQAGQPVRDLEVACLNRDASQRIVLWNASPLLDGQDQPIGHVAVGQDITELKAAQSKLIQSERLAAMGQMLSAIAHESRNALQRIQAGVDMLEFELDGQPEAKEDLVRIARAGEDLQRLFDELRSYAAPVKIETSECRLSNVWRRAWSHLEVARTGRDAELRAETNGVDLTCAIDAFRVEQVFRNLMENSLGACSDPIRIEISCHNSELDGAAAVCVSVRDNGPGLLDERKKRVFEAFFTTKPKGTGLGMAIAQRIIEAHQGTIRVGEAHKGGAEFLITLPRNISIS